MVAVTVGRRASRRWLACFLLSGVGIFTGCSEPPAGIEVVRFWAMGSEAEALGRLLPEFERLNPGIRVEIQQLAWTAAHEKLLTAVAGDATPDICQLGNTWIAEFSTLDALERLDPFLSASPAIDRGDYFAGIWATNVTGGTTWGVPWYVDTRLLFYRRDILAEAGYRDPPQTWDEWREMMTAVKRHVGPDRYAILLPLNEFEPLQVLALQQPDSMLRDGDRYGNFSSPSFRKALEFYVGLFEAQLAPPVANTQISNVWLELGRGYFSFYLSGPWNVGEFRRRLAPELQHTWMTAPMPGPEGPGASNAGGSSLVIFRRSRHKAAAWALIEFLSQPHVQLQLYEWTGNLPPRRETWKTPQLSSDAHLRAFRQQLERVRPSPQVPEWERIMEEMRLMAERVSHGRESVVEGTTALDARVDQLLEKRRWMLDRAGSP